MDVSRSFLDILKSIDYYAGHLHKDLFANEEQHPELLSIFTWFINNVSPKSNCVTPKELKLYNTISSKRDHYFSLEKASEAIDKFYDKSTKDSVICSTDLECLEEKILKSQQELNNLKECEILYEKKILLVDQEISLLREKENSVKLLTYNTENDLETVWRMFTDTIDTFGSGINKLNSHITDSMKNEKKNLIQLSSISLVHLLSTWRNHIFEMAHTWFEEENNISSETNDTYSLQIKTLNLLYRSIAALRSTEIMERFEITKLNAVINNFSIIQNYYNEDSDYLHKTGVDLTNFLANYIQPCDIPVHSDDHSTVVEFDELHSSVSDMLITFAKQKCSKLESINNYVTHFHDSIEHYIIMCDVLWCLNRTSYSITNLTCELVLRCTEILDKIMDDIMYARQWNSNQVDKQSSDIKTTNNCTMSDLKETLNFNGYKRNFNIDTCSDEIEELSKLTQRLKSKFNFNRNESNRLIAIEKKLQMYNNTLNELRAKHLK